MKLRRTVLIASHRKQVQLRSLTPSFWLLRMFMRDYKSLISDTTVAPPKPARSLRKRCLRVLLFAVGSFFIISILLVLALRWLPVPIAGIMIERNVQDWLDDKPDFKADYQWVSLSHINKAMPLAVMAGEDQLFPSHHGFDLAQMEKAWQAHQRGKRLRGASTISQQVAKNLFLWSGRSFVRKGLEAYFTLLIESLWDKRRIIEVHMNIVEFGNGLYGVQAASQYYFKRDATKLSWTQAALLAAVLPNPHRFRADKPSAYVQRRQAWISSQMVDMGGIAYFDQLH